MLAKATQLLIHSFSPGDCVADVGHLDEKQTQALQAFKALLFAQGLYKTDPVPTHDEATLLRWGEETWYIQARHMLIYTI